MAYWNRLEPTFRKARSDFHLCVDDARGNPSQAELRDCGLTGFRARSRNAEYAKRCDFPFLPVPTDERLATQLFSVRRCAQIPRGRQRDEVEDPETRLHCAVLGEISLQCRPHSACKAQPTGSGARKALRLEKRMPVGLRSDEISGRDLS